MSGLDKNIYTDKLNLDDVPKVHVLGNKKEENPLLLL